VGGGEEAAGEVLHAAGRHIGIAEEDVAGEVLVNKAEAIGDPGAEAGITADVAASMEEDITASMEGELGMHGADDGEGIDVLGSVREEFADRGAALAVALKLPQTAEPFAFGAGDVAVEFSGLAVELVEFWLRVEALHVGNATGHEEEYDFLGGGGVVSAGGEEALQGEEGKAVGGEFEGIPARPVRGHRETP
jgi:hypothetical protein